MRRFYIEPSVTTQPVLTIKGPEVHHIKNVLRLKPGDHINLFDGTGYEYEAVVAALDAQKVEVEIRRKFQPASSSGVQIIVAQSFLKEKKMDDLVRKICELGMAGWLPFFSQRAIARPDKKRLAGRTQRWNRIATESLKQCRRIDMPQIYEAHTFEEVLDFSRTCDLKIVFWENETTALSREMGSNAGDSLNKVLVMVGPEGGFTAQEIEMARENGFVVAGLGPRILRAETAAAAAAALAQYVFGDIGPRDS